MNSNSYSLVSTRSVKIIVFCILQKVLFEYVYTTIIFPLFQYYGFQNDFSLIRYIVSWLLYVPVPLFTIRGSNNETLSKQAVAFLLNIIYTPCLILYAYMSSTPFIILIVIYYLLMILTVNSTHAITIRLKLGNFHGFENIMIGIGYFLSFVVLFVWAYYARFRIQVDLLDVYAARIAARSFSAPRIVVYMRTMARGIIPLLVLYNLYKGKKMGAIYFAAIQLIQFFIDGSKTVVFVLLVGIFAYYFIERYDRIIDRIPEVMSIGAALAILENMILHTKFLANVVFRRVMFVPALMNYQYYELAQENGIDYYRQSLGILGNSRYSNDIARIIGQQYYGNDVANANNGLFADAYINLGAVGCILMPILIIIVLKIIEDAGEKLPKSVWAVCVIQAFFSFTSSSFFTVLITHGVILMIIMLYNLSPKDENEEIANME